MKLDDVKGSKAIGRLLFLVLTVNAAIITPYAFYLIDRRYIKLTSIMADFTKPNEPKWEIYFSQWIAGVADILIFICLPLLILFLFYSAISWIITGESHL